MGSKGGLARDVGLRWLAGGVTLALYVVMLFASHLVRSNRVDYMSFLVFGVIRWCPRAFCNKGAVVPRQQVMRKGRKGSVAWQGSSCCTIHCNALCILLGAK